MNKYFTLAFIALASILELAAGQSTLKICASNEFNECVEALTISCDTLVTEYDLQGNCCSLEVIPAYDGCRVTIGSGNCYWFPKCGDCPAQTDAAWDGIKCGLEYRDETGAACPASDYPTNWKTDPPTSAPASSNSPTWADYSCSPTMGPAVATAAPTISAAPQVSVQIMAVLGMVMAVAQM
jgi:hypothetical protein